MSSKNITVRMDEELKEKFGSICDEIGLSMGSAITIFAKKVVSESRIPFELSVHTPNRETLAAMLEAEKLSRDPNAKRYNNLKELFRELDADEV